jgi:acetolactate synthase-1/2/3 large subunit
VVSVAGWPRTDPYYEPVAEVTGPVGPLLARLVEGALPHPEPEAGRRARQVALAALQPPPGPFGPVDLVQTAAEQAPAGTLATVDAGAHFLAVMPWWPARAPGSLLISNGLATMGFALPAAIGVALARPGVPVACFVGDGGLAMTLAELETLARLALPVTVLVFDDAALSLIEVKQQPHHGGADAVRFAPVDYAAVARAMGLPSATVSTADELRLALRAGWDGPRVVDCRIDPTGYAHLIKVTRG